MLPEHSDGAAALGIQADGTCPACGRFVQIACSVHGHLEGDPWDDLEKVSAAARDLLDTLDRNDDWPVSASNAIGRLRAALGDTNA